MQSIVSELHANQQNGPAANVNELRGVSEDFTDYTDQQDDKLTRITQQLEGLKMAFSAERAEVAQGHAMAHAYATAETAHTGTATPHGCMEWEIEVAQVHATAQAHATAETAHTGTAIPHGCMEWETEVAQVHATAATAETAHTGAAIRSGKLYNMHQPCRHL